MPIIIEIIDTNGLARYNDAEKKIPTYLYKLRKWSRP